MPHPYLTDALALAATRRGFCAPNPAVGAILVQGDQVVGRGTHWAAGHPHAEVEAVREAGDLTRGATLYCTLEPCCHFGRTPPCTDLLIRSGVSRVVFGYLDPNPKVAGQGRRALEAQGIAVEHCPLPQIDAFYESYRYWTETRRPRVTYKLAMSLDGGIALPDGKPVALTGPEAAARTHEERKRCDAILTTARTVLADDPRLDARTSDGPHAKTVYVIDTRAETPPDARILSHARNVVILHGADASRERLSVLASKGATLCEIPTPQGRSDAQAVLDTIGDRGVHDLWVEAGGELLNSFRPLGQPDRLLLYIAPLTLGKDAVKAFPREGGFHDFSDDFRSITWQSAGRDAVVEFRR